MNRTLAAAVLILLLVPAAAPAAQEAGHGAELNPEYWWDQFVKFFNLAIVLGALVFLLRKPVGKFFRERAKRIDESLAAAQKARSDAEHKLEEVEERVAGLDGEIEKILKKARSDGQAEKERIIADAEAQAQRLLERTEEQIANRAKEAERELKAFAAEQAVEKAGRLIRRRLRPDDERRLVQQCIDHLGDRE